MKLTTAAPAKVNLWLRVGARRDDGYHDLDTLFCALQLADTVTVRRGEPGSGVRLKLGAAPPLGAVPELGPEDRNLAVRAATLFLDRADGGDYEIRIIKRIPPGGGLGGGSSDAAAVLRALARLHGFTDHDALLDMATGLGSDVPFFLSGRDVARGFDRGTRLEACEPLPPRTVLVMIPDFGTPTRDAYAWLDQDREAGSAPPPAEPPAATTPGPVSWDRIAEAAVNDFESPVFRRNPHLARVRDGLLDHGARLALLAGSGSTVFGVFQDRAAAEEAARALRPRLPAIRALVTRTRSR